MTKEELIEELAHFEHDSWSHWMDYLFSKCKQNEDGSMTIPAELVYHWTRQLTTKYVDLTEKERESDRVEVRKILPIIEEYKESVRL
jgi:hypothetical protein